MVKISPNVWWYWFGIMIDVYWCYWSALHRYERYGLSYANRCWILPVTVHSQCVRTCEKQCSHVTLYQDANHVICKSHFLNVFRCLNAALDVQIYLQICSEACCCFAVKQAAGRNAARRAGSDTRPWQHLHLLTKLIRAGRLKTYSMSYEYICTTGTSNTRFAWAH